MPARISRAVTAACGAIRPARVTRHGQDGRRCRQDVVRYGKRAAGQFPGAEQHQHQAGGDEFRPRHGPVPPASRPGPWALRRISAGSVMSRGFSPGGAMSSITRRGAAERIRTRSPRSSASSTSWVIISSVRSKSRWSMSSRACRLRRVMASRADQGFVEERQLAVEHQRAHQGAALAHAAGDRRRAVAFKAGQSPGVRTAR